MRCPKTTNTAQELSSQAALLGKARTIVTVLGFGLGVAAILAVQFFALFLIGGAR